MPYATTVQPENPGPPSAPQISSPSPLLLAPLPFLLALDRDLSPPAVELLNTHSQSGFIQALGRARAEAAAKAKAVDAAAAARGLNDNAHGIDRFGYRVRCHPLTHAPPSLYHNSLP